MLNISYYQKVCEMSSFEEIPEEFLCPITYELMDDPVICEDGYTYNRSSVNQLRNNRSPFTREIINISRAVSNRVLKNIIEKYKTDNNINENKVHKDLLKSPLRIKLITSETLKLLCILDNPLNLEYINNATFELCLRAVEINSLSLKFVPNEYKNEELCIKAVKQNSLSIEYVPLTILNEEICLEAIKKNVKIFKIIPTEKKNVKICIEAVKKDGLLIEYVPLNILNGEICIEAVKKNVEAFKQVPRMFMNNEICIIAVKKNGLMIQFIPKEKINEEIGKIAVLNNINALQYYGLGLEFINNKKKNKKICWIALKENPESIMYVNVIDECPYIPKSDKVVYIPKDMVKYAINNTVVYKWMLPKNSRYDFPEISNKILADY